MGDTVDGERLALDGYRTCIVEFRNITVAYSNDLLILLEMHNKIMLL